MAVILTEQDLFKYTIVNHEDIAVADVETANGIDTSLIEYDVTSIRGDSVDERVEAVRFNLRGAKFGAKKLISRIPINIFNDSFYILYNAITETSKYNIALTYDNYHQILNSQKRELLQDSNIKLFAHENLTEKERADKIIDYCLEEYDELYDLDLDDSQYLDANMEYYLKNWCREKMLEITFNMSEILGDGYEVGRKMLQGIQDADNYYKESHMIIESLLDGDNNAISESINTQTDTAEEIEEKGSNESESEIVSFTGIASIDETNKFRKGEIAVIQAGTGVGKTKFANNMAYNSLSLGKNVLYLSLEQKSTRIFPMIQARHILETGNDIPNLSDKEIIFREYDAHNESIVSEALSDIVSNQAIGRLKIDSKNIRALDMKQYLNSVWDSGFHFDVIVIDYFGLLECENRYNDLSFAINVLKSECKSFKGRGFLAIIPNQLDKQSEKDLAEGKLEGMTKTAGSETQFASRGADYVFTLEQNEYLRRVSKMRLHIGKVRLGNFLKSSLIMDVDLGRVKFTEDVNNEDTYTGDEDEW